MLSFDFFGRNRPGKSFEYTFDGKNFFAVLVGIFGSEYFNCAVNKCAVIGNLESAGIYPYMPFFFEVWKIIPRKFF